MKKYMTILGLCVFLMGCSSEPVKPKILNTAMYSATSGGMAISEKAKTDDVSINIYPLRPMPGADFKSSLDRKFSTGVMRIALSKGTSICIARVSGEINYYDVERYVNSKLVGDIIHAEVIEEQTVALELGKPVMLELPNGIMFKMEITDTENNLNPFHAEFIKK
ncbi:TPA: hypothetical protein ACPY94_000341 [Yersinia enterocolitica]|uniref:hypothetical protein n=1 Tax=Yersinia enterocolitica TaxID=630 RepID=UPI0028B571A2|nr:hypothetical protein [Yersinia enterocolitica]HDL7103782.1 hypothetical protein [Yersinia enterocolitica]HDL7176197.1 hypothetical protein [Yersinia enterocolitica]HDL7346973.1 hypothetical protein [Yersinia enterocolitica]HDL7952174.1 hypothetical protein [Yersinia enterocolitica]